MKTGQFNSGFSLIEVLVAMLVLTIGLLGMANLQSRSIAGGYDAYLRTQASALAHSIIDRMRANRRQALGTPNYKTSFEADPLLPTADCGRGCSPQDMARQDVLEWKCNLGAYLHKQYCAGLVSQATLPNGDGQIEDYSASGQTRVSVRWTDSAGVRRELVVFTSL